MPRDGTYQGRRAIGPIADEEKDYNKVDECYVEGDVEEFLDILNGLLGIGKHEICEPEAEAEAYCVGGGHIGCSDGAVFRVEPGHTELRGSVGQKRSS